MIDIKINKQICIYIFIYYYELKPSKIVLNILTEPEDYSEEDYEDNEYTDEDYEVDEDDSYTVEIGIDSGDYEGEKMKC